MMKQDRWSRRSGRGIFEMRSVRLSEHVLQRQYHLSGGRGINLSQMPTEPRTVQRPHLIQRNFALMPLKGAIHAKWKSFLCTGQWSDNHCADGTVHFLRRDHEAWPRLAHFPPTPGSSAARYTPNRSITTSTPSCQIHW